MILVCRQLEDANLASLPNESLAQTRAAAILAVNASGGPGGTGSWTLETYIEISCFPAFLAQKSDEP